MEIPFVTAWQLQLGLNALIILSILYMAFVTIKLIIGVRGRKIDDVEKRKRIKKLVISSIIIVLIISALNIFFEIDPFDMVEGAVDGVYMEVKD